MAPSSAIGKLPPLTSEISKRAAKSFLKGDWLAARKDYLEILTADPTNPLTLANLGATELQLGNLEKARDYLEKALAGRPNLHRARVTLGLVYHESGLSYLALSTLAKAVAGGNRGELMQAFKAAGGSCKGCHERYKVEDD